VIFAPHRRHRRPDRRPAQHHDRLGDGADFNDFLFNLGPVIAVVMALTLIPIISSGRNCMLARKTARW